MRILYFHFFMVASVFSFYVRKFLNISCKFCLVMMNSPSICLSGKKFGSTSFMKFSLAGFKIIGWNVFLRRLKIGPQFLWLVRYLLKSSLFVWWDFLCKWIDVSLWLLLVFFPSCWLEIVWWLYAMVKFIWQYMFQKFSELLIYGFLNV